MMFNSDKLNYLDLLERAERAMRSWDSTMSTSTQTFSALSNVSARREVDIDAVSSSSSSSASSASTVDGGDGDDYMVERSLTKRDRTHGRALENAAKLENYANGLRRILNVLRGLVDELITVSDSATLLYAKTVKSQLRTSKTASSDDGSADDEAAKMRNRIRKECVKRGARESSVLDVVEVLQAIAVAYEREYWVKWRIIERVLDYNKPQDMDGLLQAWAEDTQIAREELKSSLRRAKGVSMKLSID